MLVVQGNDVVGRAFIHQMPQLKEKTKKTSQKTRKKGVLQQAQAKRRWLADLLANKKAVAPLLEFLKVIGVGKREKAREKELKQGQKNDQAGEDLFG